MKERWKIVNFHDGYEVSSWGKVRNRKTGRVLNGSIMNGKTRYVELSKYGKINLEYLVSLHFNKHEIHQDSAINFLEKTIRPKTLKPCTRGERQSFSMKKTWDKKNKDKKLVGVYNYNHPNCSKKWRAVIKFHNKYITIGYFNKRKEALVAYQAKHLELYGYLR